MLKNDPGFMHETLNRREDKAVKLSHYMLLLTCILNVCLTNTMLALKFHKNNGDITIP